MVILMTTLSCTSASAKFNTTVDYVDRDKFFKKWYVIAARPTSMEEGAHNSIEHYRWNEKKQRIDIDFYFNKDSFDGKIKKIPQKGWIHNEKTNAHWKVRPFWPFKFDYLIIDLAEDYSWTVVGVPSEKWVWIMSDNWKMDDKTLEMIISRIDKMGYSIKDIHRVPQRW